MARADAFAARWQVVELRYCEGPMPSQRDHGQQSCENSQESCARWHQEWGRISRLSPKSETQGYLQRRSYGNNSSSYAHMDRLGTWRAE